MIAAHEVVTVDGVNAKHPITDRDTGIPQRFQVTRDLREGEPVHFRALVPTMPELGDIEWARVHPVRGVPRESPLDTAPK